MASGYTLEFGDDRIEFEGEAVPRVWVRQVGSPVNKNDRQHKEATLRGLRLGAPNRLAILPDSPETHGMIRAVNSLVTIINNDFGPLPRYGGRVRTSKFGKQSKARKIANRRARAAELKRRVAEGSINAHSTDGLYKAAYKQAQRAEGLTLPVNRGLGPAGASSSHPRATLTNARFALADSAVGSREDVLEAIGVTGRALRAPWEATAVGKGGAEHRSTDEERLTRRDAEHDLLRLLFSEDRRIAWHAAVEVARSFDQTKQHFRVEDRSQADSERVLKAIVEILHSEGHRYFSLVNYSTSPHADGNGVLLQGSMVVSRALDFGAGRRAELSIGAGSLSRNRLIHVFADGGLEATDVTIDPSIDDNDGAILVANRFSLNIPRAQAEKRTKISLVVPGILVDTIRLEALS